MASPPSLAPAPPPYQTSPSAAAFIQGHLDEDLELIAQQRGTDVIQPVLPAECRNGLLPVPAAQSSSGDGGPVGLAGGTYRAASSAHPGRDPNSTDKFMILQVVAVQDISLPLEQRLRMLAGDQNARSFSSSSRRHRHDRVSGDWNDDGSSSSGNDEGREEVKSSENPAAASVADSVLQASEAAEEARRQQRKRKVSARRRWLSLVLSDGFTRVLAVEARPPMNRNSSSSTNHGKWAAFLGEGVALGAKLKVFLAPPNSSSSLQEEWKPSHSHGVLRLHRDNTILMGGAVAALELYWQRWAVEQLSRLSGRPAKIQQDTVADHLSNTNNVDRREQVTAGAPRQAPAPSTDVIAHAVLNLPLPMQQQQQYASQAPPSLPCLPLQQWPTWAANNGTSGGHFLTRAVVTEVVSDLLINEREGDEEAQAEQHTDGDACTYSLMVALSDPDSSSGTDDFTLHVDLGHAWLRQLVGMPAARFRALSLSPAEQDVAELQRLIDRVGAVLEGLGTAFFHLRRRPSDGAVEVVKLEPVVGGGYVQQQQQQS